MRRSLVLVGTLAAVLIGVALPASAHVSITPRTAQPGQLELYTVQVPNELPDQATVEVDVTLPSGFTLDVAQSVPGWRTVITTKAGVPVSVAWKAGRIPVGTFASFELQGRNPRRAGALAFPVVQRYERTTVSWNGPQAAQDPTPRVLLSADLTAAPGSAVAAAPAGPATADTPTVGDGSDRLARSRAALAIALAVLALGLVLGPLAVATLRRRSAGAETSPPASAAREPVPAVPAARAATPGRPPAPVSTKSSAGSAKAGRRGG